MRLVTYDDGVIGVVVGESVVPFTLTTGGPSSPPTGWSAMRRLIAEWDTLADVVRNTPMDSGIPLARVRLQAPVPDSSKIIAAPVNYLDHQHEMSQTSDISHLGVFLKAPSVGHRTLRNDPAALP